MFVCVCVCVPVCVPTKEHSMLNVPLNRMQLALSCSSIIYSLSVWLEISLFNVLHVHQ